MYLLNFFLIVEWTKEHLYTFFARPNGKEKEVKKFFNWRILVIVILIVILCVMVKEYLKKEDELQTMPDISMKTEDANIEILNFDGVLDENEESKSNEISSKSDKILQTTAEVISGLSEKVELHATYYLSECYVQNNQEVKQGENILKYTNGTYLVAPYDCIITELNIPSENEECTNNHYVSISSSNTLAVKLKVDESKISKFYIGQSVIIKVSALDNKVFEGYITKISSTASNGKFTITAQFENDESVKLGMSSSVEI